MLLLLLRPRAAMVHSGSSCCCSHSSLATRRLHLSTGGGSGENRYNAHSLSGSSESNGFVRASRRAPQRSSAAGEAARRLLMHDVAHAKGPWRGRDGENDQGQSRSHASAATGAAGAGAGAPVVGKGAASAYFNAYLRHRSSPFTQAVAEDSPSLQQQGQQRQEWLVGSSFLEEWTVQPPSSPSSFPSSPSGVADRSRRDGAQQRQTRQTTTTAGAPPSSSRRARGPAESADRSLGRGEEADRVVLASLRAAVDTRMQRQRRRLLQAQVLHQYGIMKEVSQVLVKIHRGLSLPRDRGGDGGELPGSDKEDKTREDILYSLDAQLFERVGQVQRGLQTLSPAHYAAAAALPVLAAPPPSSSIPAPTPHEASAGGGGTGPRREEGVKGQPALMKFIQQSVLFLSLVQHQLPRLAGPFLSPRQSEGFARQSGARRAVQQAVSALLTTPTSTFLSAPSRGAKRKSDGPHPQAGGEGAAHVDAAAAEQIRRVFAVLEAVLALPYEDSPEIALPASAIHSMSAQRDEREPLTMKAEEWCVRFLLRARLLRRHETAKAETEEETSLRQRMRVIRACLATQDEQMFAQIQHNHHHHHHRAGSTSRPHLYLSFPSVKTAPSATSLWRASGGRERLRVPYGVGKEFVLQTIQHLMTRFDTAAAAAKQRREPTDEGDRLFHQLGHFIRGRDMAALCTAILFFDIAQVDAMRLLAAAAPLCAAEADLLSGADIASLLLCYATLRFDGQLGPSPSSPVSGSLPDNAQNNLYVILGTRAGELGDALPTQQVVTVLRAFELVADKVDASTLTAALESSLRMRQLHKRTQYDAL